MKCSNDKLEERISRAEEFRIHHIFVFGRREQEANAVVLRAYSKRQRGVKPRTEVVAHILAAISSRKP